MFGEMGLVAAVVVVVAAVMLFLHFVPLGLWVSAMAAGVNVGIF
ncbi:MAG: UPF0365 family protein, partial [Veillonella sp.]|nr:UPF0365 family protein [Veillonella sp.]